MLARKQGEIKDLEKMSPLEVKELLSRQERLLRNEKFLLLLPDKGEKVRKFAQKLRKIIEEKTNVDKAAELFDNLKINSEKDASIPERDKVEGKIDSLSNIFSREGKKIKEPFKPNRTLHSKDIPDELTPHKPHSSNSRPKKASFHELNSAYNPPVQRENTAEISLQESLRIQEEQQQKIKIALAEQAAEKLVDRLGIKIGDVSSETLHFKSFREPQLQESDSDEDISQAPNLDYQDITGDENSKESPQEELHHCSAQSAENSGTKDDQMEDKMAPDLAREGDPR